jgi:pimeloyl-ACP methyl ester carboxylesterase
MLGVLVLAPGFSLARTSGCNPADKANAVAAGRHCIAIATYKGSGAPRAVVVWLHGDVSRGGPAGYMKRYAQNPAAGVVSIVMLRPGYGDRDGRRSSGSDGGRRDHYTAENVDAIAAALRGLRGRFGKARLIVIGHSGGAAITATIIGRHPGLIDGAILVSCPCDLPAWRAARGRRPWYSSLNPTKFVDRVPKSTRVFALTGAQDFNTRPGLAKQFVARLRARGVPAEFSEVPGARHGFSRLAHSVRAALQRALAAK